MHSSKCTYVQISKSSSWNFHDCSANNMDADDSRILYPLEIWQPLVHIRIELTVDREVNGIAPALACG